MKFSTIAPSKALFQYTRSTFTSASAAAFFQKIMNSLLTKIKGVVVFLNDILITAPDRKLHLETLE